MNQVFFQKGDSVSYVGDGLDGLPPAQGKIMAFASQTAAHVEWLDGPSAGAIDLISLHDLEHSASLAATLAPSVSASDLVRQVWKREGEPGVLSYLAATHHLATWEDIGRDVVSYVEGRLKSDASMDMPFEQLPEGAFDQLISMGARTLLRDLFSGDDA